jgi:hypothetical protein
MRLPYGPAFLLLHSPRKPMADVHANRCPQLYDSKYGLKQAEARNCEPGTASCKVRAGKLTRSHPAPCFNAPQRLPSRRSQRSCPYQPWGSLFPQPRLPSRRPCCCTCGTCAVPATRAAPSWSPWTGG